MIPGQRRVVEVICVACCRAFVGTQLANRVVGRTRSRVLARGEKGEPRLLGYDTEDGRFICFECYRGRTLG